MSTLLQVNNLKVGYERDDAFIHVLKGLDFHVNKGETLGIVGESGCGKSMTSLAIMGLLKHRGLAADEGEILWQGKNLLAMSDKEWRQILGNNLAMIFQEPMTALNPMLTVGTQIIEQIRAHMKLSKKDAKARAIDMLRKVGIPSPETRIDMYPHELSGGMRQRVMIAMAISCEPELLIADEPTTALDVTIQAQILELLSDVVKETHSAMILITHDLGVVSNYCQRVVVMYSGKIMEVAQTRALFEKPHHPYTKGLIHSVQSIEQNSDRIASIPGLVPMPGEKIPGCVFCNRCTYATDICSEQQPPLQQVADGRQVSCWHYEQVLQGGEA